MKARIYAPGDPGVGIPETDIQIDLGFEALDEEEREDIRNTLQEAFSRIVDAGVRVTLSCDDEWTAEADGARTATDFAKDALGAIVEERVRQDALWGEQNHAFPRWLAILQEEIGEAAEAANDAWTSQDEDTRNMLLEDVRRELIQAAAVAMAMIECLDRLGVDFIDKGGNTGDRCDDADSRNHCDMAGSGT